jgi:LacI family transcriptional regulator
LKEVATLAGVHPATASRALNQSTRKLVNANTAARVESAARKLGYTANPIARSLKTSRSATIGVVLPDLTNPLFPPIVRGIEEVLRGVGYNAWLTNTDNSIEREADAVKSLRHRSVEGFVFATARLDHPLLTEMARASTPMVLVNRRVADSEIPSVTSEDASGVRMAMKHLYDLGHRSIIHLAGPQDISTGQERSRAFRQAAEELGLPSHSTTVEYCGSWSIEAGERSLRRAIDRGANFTAILAGNDLLALGAYATLAERGLRCPEDVSVVGFNDMPFIDRVSPPLTSVRIPHYEIGAEAARLLLEVIEDPTRHPRSVLLPLSLVVRGSTGPRRA